jgi:hypothetical protein
MAFFGKSQAELYSRLQQEVVQPHLGSKPVQAAYFGSGGNVAPLLLSGNFDTAVMVDERPLGYGQPRQGLEPEGVARENYYRKTQEENYLTTESLRGIGPPWWQFKWDLEALGVSAASINVTTEGEGVWKITFPFALPGGQMRLRTVWFVQQLLFFQALDETLATGNLGKLKSLGVDLLATNLLFDKGSDVVKDIQLQLPARLQPGSLVITDQLGVADRLSSEPTSQVVPISSELAALSHHFGRVGDVLMRVRNGLEQLGVFKIVSPGQPPAQTPGERVAGAMQAPQVETPLANRSEFSLTINDYLNNLRLGSNEELPALIRQIAKLFKPGSAWKNQVRIRTGGIIFKAGYEEVTPGKISITENLPESEAVFVVTLPRIFSRILNAAPAPGGWRNLVYWVMNILASWGVFVALFIYTYQAQRSQAALAADRQVEMQDYTGEHSLNSPAQFLHWQGGLLGAKDFYKPQGNRKLAALGSELGELAEFFQQAATGGTETLWTVIQKQALPKLLQAGKTPSCAQLVQALDEVDLKTITDANLRNLIAGLQSSLRYAVAQNQPSLLQAERNRIVHLITRSSQALPLDKLLTATPQLPTGQTVFDEIHMVLDPVTRQNLLGLTANLLSVAKAGTPLRANLEIFQKILGQEVISGEQGAQLQWLLAAIAPSKNNVISAYVGEDVNAQAAALALGGMELQPIMYRGIQLMVARPAVATAVAKSAAELAALNGKAVLGEQMSVIPFTGEMPPLLPAAGNFAQDTGHFLTTAAMFKNLGPQSELAQAYYRWFGKKDKSTAQMLARVAIRMLKYEARQIDQLPLEARSVRLQAYTDAVAVVSTWFQAPQIFSGKEIGTLDGKPVFTPAALSRGSLLGYIAACQQAPNFILNENLDSVLRQERLLNFHISGAA